MSSPNSPEVPNVQVQPQVAVPSHVVIVPISFETEVDDSTPGLDHDGLPSLLQ